MFRLIKTIRKPRRRNRPPVPQGLSPRLMRDIGLDPLPDTPRLTPHPRW